MSNGYVRAAFERSRSKGSALLVLLALAEFADSRGDGVAWPSLAQLANFARVHRRNVQRALDVLMRLREIEVVTTRRGGQPGSMTRFRICLPVGTGGANATPTGGAGATPEGVTGGAGATPTGGAGATQVDTTQNYTAQHSRARAPTREAIEEATEIVTELRAVAAGLWPGDLTPARWLASDIVKWFGRGASRLLIIDTCAAVMARMSQGERFPPLVLSYFSKAIDDAIADCTRALPRASTNGGPRLGVIDGGVT